MPWHVLFTQILKYQDLKKVLSSIIVYFIKSYVSDLISTYNSYFLINYIFIFLFIKISILQAY